MTEAQVVQIPTAGLDKTSLSKAQKEFNRLTKKISALETELNEFRAAATHIRQRIQSEYVPLLSDYNKHRVNLVRVFDRAHDRPETTRTEQKKLVDLIVSMANELISQHGMNELKPIFDKYETRGFDMMDAEADGQVLDEMKERMTARYGIDFDENVDVSTQAKFRTYVEEQMQARRENEEKHTKKPKSGKQQERESRKQLEERNITKAVRTLYMNLVKAFHPDREPDEAEKERKTTIMQRITEAYEKGDLFGLLRLQLAYNHIDQSHLETIAEDQLKYYNKILTQQANELGKQLFDLQSQLSAELRKPLTMVGSVLSLEFSFNNDIRELKRSVKDMKREVNVLSDPVYLKGWLKTYTT